MGNFPLPLCQVFEKCCVGGFSRATGCEMPMVDTRIRIDRASTTGDEVHIEWTGFSRSLPGGKGYDLNRFNIKNGLIVSLTTTLCEGDPG